MYSSGSEIRGFEDHNKRLLDVIENENRIEAVDFDPMNEMIYWVDSYNRSIRRSYMVNAQDGKVKMGYAQSLNIESE